MDLIQTVWCLVCVTPGLLAAPMSPLFFAGGHHAARQDPEPGNECRWTRYMTSVVQFCANHDGMWRIIQTIWDCSKEPSCLM